MTGAARLSTHVLDTGQGRPGAGVRVDVGHVQGDGSVRHLKTLRTDDHGRAVVLDSREMAAGTFVLTFHVAEYFRAAGLAASAPPYLDLVPIRFTIADPAAHYHVPLLVSPWSYTTYRGS
jgi:5-hydroxyisourate hydrolase